MISILLVRSLALGLRGSLPDIHVRFGQRGEGQLVRRGLLLIPFRRVRQRLQAIDRAVGRGEITADAELTNCDDVASDGDLLVNFYFFSEFCTQSGGQRKLGKR